jgi:F-type H+-transporting ATPase subunit b
MQRPSRLAIGIGFFALLLVLHGHPLAAQEPHPKPAEAAPGHAPAAAVEKAEHGSVEAPNPMKVEPALVIWSLLVFVLLLTVLTKFAWKPLIHALHEREKHLEHVLHETERARNESEGLLSEHRKQMAQAADEVRGLLEKARQDAQRTGEQIVKRAQTEADAAKQRAQRDIGAARDQALAEIWQKTADMAVSVAGRVLSKELTDADHRRLLDVAINELPAAPGANGRGGKT